MILLDTDHLTVFRLRVSDRAVLLRDRLRAVGPAEPIGTTVVNVEESMRGWMASIARERSPHRQVTAYRELAGLFEFFRGFDIAPFDERAADLFTTYGRIRAGTRDRKIGAIAVARSALLLTANRQDFEQIPGLRFENWLDG
jgi:tRNA(fMet)-specific endonuclease VapC